MFIPGWSRPNGHRYQRFLNKLFLPDEQEAIQDLPNFGEPLLWSMKEAAYKLIYRQSATYSYAPKSLATRINLIETDRAEGEVRFRTLRIITRTQFLGDYLHTMALAKEDSHKFKKLESIIAQRRKDESDYLLPVNKNEFLSIVKDEQGVPQLDYPDSLVSISHDGDKIAYAWIRGYKDA